MEGNLQCFCRKRSRGRSDLCPITPPLNKCIVLGSGHLSLSAVFPPPPHMHVFICVSSNSLPGHLQTCIDCTCLTFLHCAHFFSRFTPQQSSSDRKTASWDWNNHKMISESRSLFFKGFLVFFWTVISTFEKSRLCTQWKSDSVQRFVSFLPLSL